MLRELMPTTPAKWKTTMREISGDLHVDPSRLRYLFGSKAELCAQTPTRPHADRGPKRDGSHPLFR